MARIEQTVCDACGKILLGRERKAYHNEDYIHIRGTISLQLRNQELEERSDGYGYESAAPRYHIFVTPKPDFDLSLCDVKCFKEYIDQRRAHYEQARENMLREETSR